MSGLWLKDLKQKGENLSVALSSEERFNAQSLAATLEVGPVASIGTHLIQQKAVELKNLVNEKIETLPSEIYEKIVQKAQSQIKKLNEARNGAEDIHALVSADPAYRKELQELEDILQTVELLRDKFSVHAANTRLEYLRLKADASGLKETPINDILFQETNRCYESLVDEAESVLVRDGQALSEAEIERYRDEPLMFLAAQLQSRRVVEAQMQAGHIERNSWSHWTRKQGKAAWKSFEMLPMTGIGLGVAYQMFKGVRSVSNLVRAAGVWGFMELGVRGAVREGEKGYREVKAALQDPTKEMKERILNALAEGGLASAKAGLEVFAGRFAMQGTWGGFSKAFTLKVLGEPTLESVEGTLNWWEATREIKADPKPFERLPQELLGNILEVALLMSVFGRAAKGPGVPVAALGAEEGAALAVRGETGLALREETRGALARVAKWGRDLVSIGTEAPSDLARRDPTEVKSTEPSENEGDAFRYEILGHLTQVEGSRSEGDVVWHNRQATLYLPKGLSRWGSEAPWTVVSNDGQKLQVSHPKYGDYFFAVGDVKFNRSHPEKIGELQLLQPGSKVGLAPVIKGAAPDTLKDLYSIIDNGFAGYNRDKLPFKPIPNNYVGIFQQKLDADITLPVYKSDTMKTLRIPAILTPIMGQYVRELEGGNHLVNFTVAVLDSEELDQITIGVIVSGEHLYNLPAGNRANAMEAFRRILGGIKLGFLDGESVRYRDRRGKVKRGHISATMGDSIIIATGRSTVKLPKGKVFKDLNLDPPMTPDFKKLPEGHEGVNTNDELFLSFLNTGAAITSHPGFLAAEPKDQFKALLHYVEGAMAHDAAAQGLFSAGFIADNSTFIEAGIGVCRNYTILISSLLSEAGFKPKIVTAYLGDISDGVGYYHAWVEVEIEERGKKETYILDLAGTGAPVLTKKESLKVSPTYNLPQRKYYGIKP